MPRSSSAYLVDIVEACEAIGSALAGIDADVYATNRLVRSSVEREFMVIGEAVASLARLDPALASRITHERLIVGFRNRLARDYATIDNETVLWIARHDVPVLLEECRLLLAEISAPGA